MTTTTTKATTTAEAEGTTSRKISRSPGRLEREAAGAYVGDLFAEHGRMVLGLCRLLLRDPVEAEDAAQQVFLSAHQAILRGSPPRDQAAWMAAIARNECRARIRARMREPLALPELPSDLPDPLAAAIRSADLRAVWVALGALPRRQRNALVLRELGGLSYHELGRTLGVSHSAIESLLFRARERVRSFVAGASAAAVPFALRDEVARLVPGFDSGSAGVVGRLAALPAAWKLAGAAVGVGVVVTGTGGIHSRSFAHPHPTEAAVIPQKHATVQMDVAVPLAVSVHAVTSRVSRSERVREVEHVRVEHVEHVEHVDRAEHADVQETEHRGESGSEAPDVTSGEPARLDVADSEDHSGSDDSGSDGGSEHSGPD